MIWGYHYFLETPIYIIYIYIFIHVSRMSIPNRILVTSFHLPTCSWTENNPGKGPKRPKRPKIWNHLEEDTKDLSKYWVDTTGNGTWVSWRKTDQPQNILKVQLCFFIQNETIWLSCKLPHFQENWYFLFHDVS